jgi:hypothetical protein
MKKLTAYKKTTIILAVMTALLFGCSKPIDEQMDRQVQGVVINLGTPGLLDDPSMKTAMCGSVRIMLSALVSSGSKIQEKTNKDFNKYAVLCGVEQYKN